MSVEHKGDRKTPPTGGVQIEDLPRESDAYVRAKRVESFFTVSVNSLRTEFPDPRVRCLMSIAWDLYHHKIIETAMGPVTTTAIAVIGTQTGTQRAIIVMPTDWPERVEADAIMQVGGIVYVSSQAVDFWNGKLVGVDPKVVDARARAYEASFLLGVRAEEVGWQPNGYQAEVLKQYPEGLATPSAAPLLYDPKPFVRA